MTRPSRYYVWDEHGGKANARYIEAETRAHAGLKYVELRHTEGLMLAGAFEVMVQSPNQVSEAFRFRMVLDPTFHVERVDG